MLSAEPEGFPRLAPLVEARSALFAALAPVAPVRRLLSLALGLTCAETSRSGGPLPRVRTAVRDGFAVASCETVGATPHAPVYASSRLPVAWADTAIGSAYDSVLLPDALMVGPDGAEILQAVAPGTGAREAGHDIQSDAVVVRAGDRLRPDRIAVLALAGFDEVAVRVPQLSIDGTGAMAELVRALAVAEGVGVCGSAADATLVLAPPGRAATAAALHLAAAGGTLIAHGLAVRPGEAIGLCSTVRVDGRSTLVFVVPDRLEEVMAAWLLIIRPSLAILAGRVGTVEATTLPLTRKVVSSPGVAELVLLRRNTAAAWEPLAVGDLPWSAFAAADAFAVIPPESEGVQAGGLLAGSAL